MNNLLMRSLSGIVYVALIVLACLACTPWFYALTALFLVLALPEFQNITMGKARTPIHYAVRIVDMLMALVIVNVNLLWFLPLWAFDVTLLSFILYLPLRLTLSLYDKGQQALVDTAYSILSIAYVAIPLLALNFIYYEQGAQVVLPMFILIWINDTGAYCFGSTLGKNKLFPRLSPKKSWEGFIGGLGCCIASGFAFSYIIDGVMPMWGWMLFGAVVSLLSTWGDLFESLLKRTFGIKDSGKIIPGHGGILDRIDSLLFVAMGTAVIALFF